MGTQDINDSRPAFARVAHEDVELRFYCPRAIVDVVDAVVMARGGQAANIHRGTVLVEVLNAWAEKKRHESNLIQRIAGGHPTGVERAVQDLRVVEQGKAA